MRKRVARLALFAIAVAPWLGCQTVRVEERPVSDVVLMVARNAEEAILSWPSKRGETYTILYADSRDTRAKWQPLPAAARVVGTGETMTIRDPVPANQPRYYRILVLQPTGRRP